MGSTDLGVLWRDVRSALLVYSYFYLELDVRGERHVCDEGGVVTQPVSWSIGPRTRLISRRTCNTLS